VPIFEDIESDKVLNHTYIHTYIHTCIHTYIHKLLTLERYAVVEEVCSVCVCACANREKRERFHHRACSITVIADML
jgi:hypothetical protein